MLKWLRPQLRLGVAPRALGLLGGRSGKLGVLAEQDLGPDGASQPAALQQGLRLLLQQGGRGRPLHLVLADPLLRLWQVEPPQQASSLADLQAAASLRFQTLFGDDIDTWQLSAHWDARRPFWAAALPRAMHAVLHQVAAEYDAPIVSMVPQFIANWNRYSSALDAGTWLACGHDGLLSVGIPGASRLQAVRVLPLVPDTSLDGLRLQLGREAARAMLSAPAQLALCGQVPAAWQEHSAALPCRLLAPLPPEQADWPAACRLAACGSAA